LREHANVQCTPLEAKLAYVLPWVRATEKYIFHYLCSELRVLLRGGYKPVQMSWC